ncbi:MAG: PfaB family protein [Elainella sp.]
MERIAVVGLSCLFPGAATPEQFWENLIAQKDVISQLTKEQVGVDPDLFYNPEKGTPDRFYCKRSGFIRDFQFDPTGYRFAPEFLEGLDDIFKWSLYVAKQALIDSGYLDRPDFLAKCGVILGNLSSPTKFSQRLVTPIYRKAVEAALQELLQQDLRLPGLTPEQVSPFNLFTAGYPSTLIPQALGLSGTSFTLDAACASPLYAVQLACEYLISRKADLMLAGAVSCSDPFVTHIGFSLYRAYPSDGICRPLDQNSGGMITGEGAGMLALKRYSDAVRDGDKIYATILGVGLSNDGKGKHFLTPSSKGQKLAFERAYVDAGVNPQSIAYVECHATGTDLGDKTELSSMDAFFGQYGGKPKIGSVKSNLGHLLTAAGMPSMIKVILSMANGVIPPTINVREPLASNNDVIAADQVVTEMTPWPQTLAPVKRAAVSAFGFGGTNAHLVMEQPDLSQPAEPPAVPPVEPIAIIGMDAFFGPCDGLDAFDRSIYEGQQHFVSVPPERWQGIEKSEALLKKYGFEDGQAPQGAYIESFDVDFLRYKIQPNLYEQPIPQQLLILKVADEALQNANLPEGGNVAVIVAMETEGNAHLYRARCDSLWQIPEGLAQANLELADSLEGEIKEIVRESICWPAQVNRYISYVGNIMASRISAAWDFTGPSLTISAGENSTFKALEVAQILLADRKVDAVVVGAVDLAGGVENVLLRQKLAASHKGEPVPGLDVQSSGWLVGEGAGAVVLKRLDQAKQSADRIYATIDAISLSQEQTLAADQPTSPSPQTVAQTCQTAFAQAGVTAADVGYLEVYGSGVPQEDWAEIGGITQAYRTGSPDLSCALGTVKANIGHTFSASGMASLIKSALCIYHRYIPALPQWTAPKHPELWQGSPFYVASESTSWPVKTKGTKRIAAINGLALDGSCAHVILSEDLTQTQRSSQYLAQMPLQLLPLVAADQASLLHQLQQLQQQIEASNSLHPIASQLFSIFQQSQSAGTENYVVVIVGSSKTEVLQEIHRGLKGIERAFQQGRDWQTPAGSYFTPHPQGKTGKVAFVYPGAFMSYMGMGRDVFRLFPNLHGHGFEDSNQLDELLYGQSQRLYPRSLTKPTARQLEALDTAFSNDSEIMLVSGTVAAIQATAILRDSFRLQPQIAFGYSLGELSMLFSLGIWSDIDTISSQMHSSELFKTRLAGPKTAIREAWGLEPASTEDDFWGSFILMTSAETVTSAVAQTKRVYVTHINTPNEVMIGGDRQACLQLIETLKCDYFPLPLSGILHCDPVRLEFNQLKDWASLPVGEKPPISFYTAATYGQATRLDKDSVADSIATALSQSCNFPRLITQTYEDGARIFVELGPGGSCSRWIKETLKDRQHVAFTINSRGVDNHTAIVRALARLASHQAPVDLSPLYLPLPNSQNKAKALIRTVMLPGAPRLQSSIVTEANRGKFAGQCVKRPAAQMPIVAALPQPIPSLASVQVADWVQPLSVSFTPQIQQISLPAAGSPAELMSSNGHAIDQSALSLSHPVIPVNLPDSESVNSSANPLPEPSLPQPSEPSAAQTNAAPSPSADLAQSIRLLDANMQALHLHQQQISGTTQAFLQSRQAGLRQLGELIQYQIALSGQALTDPNLGGAGALGEPAPAAKPPKPAHVIFDEDEVLEMACGKLSNVFGKEFEAIDLLPRCTRVPMPPYLFISRVTKLEAQRGVLEDCFIETEYDIPVGAWYSTGGYMPCAVAVEASHSNIFLMSYIGVDFETQGKRVYRALGGTITFMDSLPREGQTMRCEVRAHDFSRMGEMILFTFTHKTYVGDKQFMQMECKAGFFSDEDLLKGQGIPQSRVEQLMRSKLQKRFFAPLLQCSKTSFGQADLESLSRGDFAACFGPAYDPQGKNPTLTFPPAQIRMIDRVTSVDPRGGAWGLGLLTAEKTLTPEAWYFNCHFKDDYCIPGTLVGEGCGQLLAFYLLYLGLQSQMQDAIARPLLHQTQVGHYRGQILPTSGVITYQVEVTEIGLSPKPYIKAECSAIYEGKTIALMKNLGLEMVERADLPEFSAAQTAAVVQSTLVASQGN